MERTLRELARARGVEFGFAVKPDALADEPAYAEAVAREAGVLVAENVAKFGPLRPTPETFAWAPFDAVVDFAEDHGQRVRGHTLVWHNQAPAWLEGVDVATATWAHVDAVVGRYRGRIESWDVVNEAIADDGTPRDTLFLRSIGPDYVAEAFRRAHAADPGAQLVYNDYSVEEVNPKSDAMLALVDGLRTAGAPIHAVGFQAHLELASPPDLGSVAANLRRFRERGLELLVTEMDIRIPEPFDDGKRAAQGRLYRDFVRVCLDEGVSRILTWGLTDRHSWIPGFFRGTGEALPLDAGYAPKPAYHGLAEALAG